jgi:hypothetical protein
MDYKAFLKPQAPLVLPYFGGARVDAADRRFVVQRNADDPLPPGWWRFQIEGRRAVPKEPADPIDLGALPAIRGHWIDGWVVVSGRELGRIALPPVDEPQPLARVTARRWYSGDWLFDSLEFEDDAEITARLALEQRKPLGVTKGVVPSLRAAFGYALGMESARDLKIEIQMRELTPIVVDIADGGVDVIKQLFDDLVRQRREEEERRRRAAALARVQEQVKTAKPRKRGRDPRDEAAEMLDAAGARMTGFRRIAAGAQLEVTYDVQGTRITSLIDGETFSIIDPGLCLGHHNEYKALTLDIMPILVREAIDGGKLVVGRGFEQYGDDDD